MHLHMGDTFCTHREVLTDSSLMVARRQSGIVTYLSPTRVLLGRDLTARHYLVLIHSEGIVTCNPMHESHLVSVHLTPTVHSWLILTSIVYVITLCVNINTFPPLFSVYVEGCKCNRYAAVLFY